MLQDNDAREVLRYAVGFRSRSGGSQFRVEYSVVAVHPADTYPAVSGGARPRWLAAPGAVAELGHEEAQGHAHVRGTRALR